jgi:CRISPR-associated protein Cas2
MFDLPVDTPKAQRDYTRFRTALLNQGFSMLQYSVYACYFASEEASTAQRKALRGMLPPDSEVRVLAVTDKQFGKMGVYRGKSRAETESAPEQLMFF